MLDQLLSQASNTPSPIIFLVKGFLLSREVENSSPVTLKVYRYQLTKFCEFLNKIGCSSIGNVRHSHIDLYLMSFKERGAMPQTIASVYQVLHTFFNWCMAEEFIAQSPMRNMKRPKVPKISRPFLSEGHRDMLLSLCPPNTFRGARARAVVWLLWSTGIRFGELANLQLSDLDWRHNRIKIFGKSAKERFVPFTADAKKAVWRYLCYRKDDYPQLWLTKEREPMKPQGLVEVVKRLWQRAGLKGQIKDAHHIFRRSWAMRNLKAGIPAKFIQLVGGWAELTTMEQYVRAMDSEQALGAKWV